MSHKNFRTLISSLVVSLSAAVVSAETVQAPVGVLSSPVASLSFPGVFGVPSAVAPKGGSGFAGLTYVNPRGGIAGNGGDASLSAGYTVGNPVENVSVTFGLSISGTIPFGDAGSFSVSASRLLRAGGSSATFVGASASNLANWGAGSDDPEYSAYVSHLVGVQTGSVEIPMQLVLGCGTSNTRNSAGGLDDGAFAGLGVGVTENLSASVSFTRTQLNAGVTATIPDTSMSMSLGVLDATDRNDRQQVSLSIGFGF